LNEIVPSFGINAPQFHPSDGAELKRLGTFASEVERLGFESIWVQDSIFTNSLFLEPLVSLSYVAAKTRSIELGIAALLLPIRNPILVAKAVSTIDFLSGGRVILGVALGDKEIEYHAVGVSMSERVTRLKEGIEMIRLLWTEKEGANFVGRHWKLIGSSMRPKPIRSGCIPIWMGGGLPGQRVKASTLKRAARLADGWIGAGSTSLKDFQESTQKFVQYAIELGRDSAKLAIAKRVYINVNPNIDRAKRQLETVLIPIYGSESDVTQFCVFGNSRKCSLELRRFIDAGAKTLILNPVNDYFNQAEILARDVIPSVIS
jgi:alkanesulfonate monooxygenase SsuD/methylene tetrahydromethanopterin reductase-like flavin-dependent oxidoreductase (luciferase family)